MHLRTYVYFFTRSNFHDLRTLVPLSLFASDPLQGRPKKRKTGEAAFVEGFIRTRHIHWGGDRAFVEGFIHTRHIHWGGDQEMAVLPMSVNLIQETFSRRGCVYFWIIHLLSHAGARFNMSKYSGNVPSEKETDHAGSSNGKMYTAERT